LGALPQCANLLVLDISFNKLKYLSGLERLTSLKTLCINNNALTNIDGACYLTSLITFNAWGNKIPSFEAVSAIL
jgi:Leucine-rich repeat (LRR) protein